jgi:hypothetical protein
MENRVPAFICTAGGAQYPASEAPPPACTICQDERQFVPPGGQTWTTLAALTVSHRNTYRQYEPGILGIETEPHFAIGQRALLVCTPHGNVLWDMISLLDAATVTLINGLGGLAAIGISYPHFYTSMVEWSRTFGNVPIHLHAADRDWIMRPDPAIKLWDGETLKLLPDVTLVRCGGHFPGSAVLHWTKGADGRGVLCSSDTCTVTMDRKFLTFMRSYPNLIPLSAREVTGIAAALEPLAFDTIYGHHFDRVISAGGKYVLKISVERYLKAIGSPRG